MVATRKAYGETIAEMGGKFNDIIVLDADISKSTYSCLFAEKYPKRFINVGVAEQNEMMIAAGIATTGKIPFVSTYSVFASMRACEQVRTFICYPKLNVKIAVSHGGVTPGSDGPTHQATEDNQERDCCSERSSSHSNCILWGDIEDKKSWTRSN